MNIARASCLVLLLLLSMAPTPGSVGGCGGDDLDDPADLRSYCQQREELSCVRRFLRLELTALERDDCRYAAVDRCSRRFFPRDCQPTEREARGCLNALSSFDTLETQEDKIPECNTAALCSALAPSEDEDEDDGGVGR